MGARRRLTLLRHGKAHDDSSAPAGDFTRTLTKRGARDAEEMARHLLARGLAPDLIIASPALRAWATAAIVAERCGLEHDRLRAAPDLYLAEPSTIWKIAAATDASVGHLLICAHNPGLSGLASRFGPRPQARQLPTAGLASAAWSGGAWSGLEPEDAETVEFDAPDHT
ncbi:MAG: histidine phosphatase family protein [Gammaproteobacteria bacterium]|nr:histidine phosphatase family protein [Gammaproteobacteria bacterium]